jgi:signal transduction histidine kinase/ligand-binding sensor domain-containing protein
MPEMANCSIPLRGFASLASAFRKLFRLSSFIASRLEAFDIATGGERSALRFRRFNFSRVALALLCAFPIAVSATEYLIDVKDTEDDLPDSSVTAIAQTPDGYLWVGTYNGLARFDGVRFVTFDPVNRPALGQARIRDLYTDTMGTLWINTYRGGLTTYRDGVFHTEWRGGGEFDVHTTLAFSSSNEVVFATQFGEVLRRTGVPGSANVVWSRVSPPNGARYLFQCTDGTGTLWFLKRDGHIARLLNGQFHDLKDDCGLTGSKVITIASDPKGNVWAGTDRELAVWDGSSFRSMTPTNGEPIIEPLCILPTRDGRVWVLADGRLRQCAGRQWLNEIAEWKGLLGWASGRAMGMHEDHEGGVWFNHYGNGLFHIAPDGKFERFTTRQGLPSNRLWAWFQGREGDIWMGGDRGGLARLRERRFQVVGQAEGLLARAAFSVCQDAQGSLWFGTSGGGLSRWQDGKIENFQIGDDAANYVFSVFSNPAGGLWLSASAGEEWYVFRNGQLDKAPWDVHGIKAILADHTGRVWLGHKTGLSWWTPESRRSFTAADGMTPSASVRALAEGPDGSVWCGDEAGTIYRCEARGVQAFRPSDALASQPVLSLLAEKDDTIWVGTFRGGLLRFKNGKFSRVTTAQGLPNDAISEILDDEHGRLWLGTHKGICQVSKTDLNRCLDGEIRRVDCVTYGLLDGLPTLECAGNYQPACCRSSDGRLWFATVKGIVSVKPEELKKNNVPPPVVIEELRVDGELLENQNEPLLLPAGRKQFEFRYTALSFLAPDRVRFRYRLEGLEPDWIEAGTKRDATYNHLPAGDYKLQVLACNSDGVWNNAGASLAFTVLPYFYQTWWFLALASASVMGGLAVAVRRISTRRYRLALARLEQQHAIERDRARIAKDIHDDLGAGLTQITLLSELARREMPGQSISQLDRISDTARKMTRTMDEIVWAVDPQHDTLSGLMDYISAYTEDFLRMAGIRCRMDLPSELPALRVDAELRYNLFLALKEALNNVVKHAHAAEVWLRLRVDSQTITLVVEDDGQGLLPAGPKENSQRLSSGRGLCNLEKRLTTVGGRCQVQGLPGQGTRVEMIVTVENAPSPVVAIGNHTAQGQNGVNGGGL